LQIDFKNLNWRANFVGTASNPAEKQKGKKEGGWGEGIFALLRLRLERFRFSLIKRKPKQKIFHLLLKEKRGAKKIKNVIKKFLFWFAVAKRRQAETHQQNYQFSRSVRFRSEPPRARRVVSRGSVQKKLEFQPKGTATQNKNSYVIAIFILWLGRDAVIRKPQSEKSL